MPLRDTARTRMHPNTTSREVGVTGRPPITDAIVRGVCSRSAMAPMRCRLSGALWNGAVA